MMWQGKSIDTLTDDELWAAIQSVAGMDNFRFDKFTDPRIDKPKHRLNKIFGKAKPAENPAFTNLAELLNTEYQNRNK